jgi:hypothetical protein
MDLRTFIILCSFLVKVSICDPQLDIPGVEPLEEPKRKGPRVLVMPNSYTNDKFENEPKSDTNSYAFDSDRSQRYGMEFKSVLVMCFDNY